MCWAKFWGSPAGESVVAHAGAQARRQALIKSLRLLFSSVAGSQPMLMVLDDLQWINDASRDVLGIVLADVPELPVMVLAAQRPGRAIPWSEWSFVERLNLRPLDGRSAHAMARAVLGSAELSEALEAYISERAGGNPYISKSCSRRFEMRTACISRTERCAS